MIDEKTFTIALIIIIANLIISGIIGLVKKSINMHSIVWNILFFPLGIFGGIFSKVMSHAKRPEEGRLAIIASISCFAMALLLATFLTARYIPMAEIIVPIILLCIIVGVPIVIAVYREKE